MVGGTLQHAAPMLTPSLHNYLRGDLTAHVIGWPADILEKQVCIFNSRLEYLLSGISTRQWHSTTRGILGRTSKDLMVNSDPPVIPHGRCLFISGRAT